MTTTELMIGDWVLYREEVLQVTSLYTKKGANEIGFGQSENFWVDISNIEPIPLIPEILEKNGFEEDDGAYIYYNAHYDDCVNWCGTILKIGCDNGNMELADVQYVHELQHALRLCGIEKEIEL